jgi:hypothetical protein
VLLLLLKELNSKEANLAVGVIADSLEKKLIKYNT